MGRLVRLSVLDTYGVVWSRETLARDLLQNFFDATGDFRKLKLEIDRERRVVEVRGSEAFDLELLCYIGATTKNDGTTVGGFGEGFKVCALVATRDFGVRMWAGSGRERLEVVLEPIKLGRELCYRVEDAPAAEDAWVRLEGCDDALIAAFERGPDQFRHPDHPGLQEPFVLSEDESCGFYWTEGYTGSLFYRRQRRGEVRLFGLDGRGLTVVYDGVVEALEGDRDRRDITAYELVKAVGLKLGEEALWRVVDRMEGSWSHGSEILTPLLEAAKQRGLTRRWPRRWVARAPRGEARWEALAQRQGYKLAMASFHPLGMRRAEQLYSDGLVTRAPTRVEQARYDLLRGTYKTWTQGWQEDTRKLEVFAQEGAAIQGQFMADRVLITQELLAGKFAPAAGTILHELAHEAGDEESTRFLRRLEQLLYAALADQAALERLEQAWEAAGQEVVEAVGQGAAKEVVKHHPHAALSKAHFHNASARRQLAMLAFFPPGFMAMQQLAERFDDADTADDDDERAWAVFWLGVEVASAAELERLGVPGLPAYKVNEVWMTGEVVGEVRGCKLLRYGEGYVPSREAVVAAGEAHPLRGARPGAKALGQMRASLRTPEQVAQIEARNAQPVEDVTQSAHSALLMYSYRADGLRERARHVWVSALHSVAVWRLVGRATAAGGPVQYAQLQELCVGVCDEVVGWSEALRGWGESLPGYDDGDLEDVRVVALARGAALHAWHVGGVGEEGARAMMEQVWGQWQGLLGVALEPKVKEVVLWHALELAGVRSGGPALRVEALREQIAALLEEAIKQDRLSYRSGPGQVAATLTSRWEARVRALVSPPDDEVKAARDAKLREELEARRREETAHGEDAIKTWEEVMARGGDERAGLEACIERWWSQADAEVAR